MKQMSTGWFILMSIFLAFLAGLGLYFGQVTGAWIRKKVSDE